MYRLFAITALLLIPVSAFAQAGTVQEFITGALEFINVRVIPLLLGVAFLFFIVNAARYFILGSTTEEGRTKARALALWGISAFVFFGVIWGVVNLVTNGLGDTVPGIDFDNGEFVCPDYFKFFRSDCVRGTPSGSAGIDPGDLPDGVSFINGRFVVDETPDRFVVENSELALFLYGSLRESISFTTNTAAPRSTGQVVQVAVGSSCEAGFDLLTLAAERESSEAAYTLHQSTLTGTTWLNVTDSTALRFASFDADTIEAERIAGMVNEKLIHTHQERALGTLPLDAFPPSISDIEQLCAETTQDASYAIVDHTGIWTLSKTTGTCPYSDTDRHRIGVAVALNALAHIPANLREGELADLIVSPIVPDRDAAALEEFESQNLSRMSTVEVRALATDLLNQSGVAITRTSTSDFCRSF